MLNSKLTEKAGLGANVDYYKLVEADPELWTLKLSNKAALARSPRFDDTIQNDQNANVIREVVDHHKFGNTVGFAVSAELEPEKAIQLLEAWYKIKVEII